MKLKKIIDGAKYLIPFKALLDRTKWDCFKPITYIWMISHSLYSGAMVASTIVYLSGVGYTKSFNPNEQMKIIRELSEENIEKYDLQNKLNKLIDKNNDGYSSEREILDFCKERSISPSRILPKKYLDWSSFESEELEKLVQSYEAKNLTQPQNNNP